MKWNDIPKQARTDLLAWFNRQYANAEEKQLLADLYAQHRFTAWNCGRCGARVYKGNPLDWTEFQGALQVDYTSCPAKRKTVKWCDSCRCWHSKEA